MAATTGGLAPQIEYDFEDEVGPISEEHWAIKRRAVKQSLPEALNDNELPDILLAHQKELFASVSTYSLTATDKSRRVGATWGLGANAVLTAGAKESAGGMDVLYLGYNLDMAREFIDTCAMWARAFMPLASEPEEYLFKDQGEEGKEERSIQAYRIRFASGFEIIALSSAPRSLRGRQGLAILDEFAFHDDAEELLKAAMAFIIWGGKVVVISTHNGSDNPFNKLLEDIRKGEYGSDANVVRVTFDQAVDNGLYERVCLKRGIEWTAEGEAKWRANIRKIYRHNAAEELDCIPNEGSGVYLTRSQIEACCVPPDRVLTFICPPKFELKDEVFRHSYVRAWLDQNVKPLLDALDPNLQHAYGQDFARSGDNSVIVPIQIGRDLVRSVPFVLELRNVPYEQQKSVALFVIDRLPRFMGAKLDATGNGGYLGEVVMQKYGAALVEPVKMSQAWYADNMPRMKDGIEGKRLLYPANDNLVSDLRMIMLVRGVPMVPQGLKADGTDGLPRHGDFAVALCLANAASLGKVLTCDGFRSVTSNYHRKAGAGFHADDEPDYLRGTRFTNRGTW